MGTRHLIEVIQNGERKVSQYGQWDGYPSGQGLTILAFLEANVGNQDAFREAVRNASFVSEDEAQALVEGQEDDWQKLFPQFSRDTGAGILQYVLDHPEGAKLLDHHAFAGDGLFCEWAYVIDLDAGTLEVYKGFGHERLTPEDRYFDLQLPDSEYKEYKNEDGSTYRYYPVKLAHKWSLSVLPSKVDFLATLEPPEDEDEE